MRTRIRAQRRWHHRDRRHPGISARRCSPPSPAPEHYRDLVQLAARHLHCTTADAEPHVREVVDRIADGMPLLVIPGWMAAHIGDHPAAQEKFVFLIYDCLPLRS